MSCTTTNNINSIEKNVELTEQNIELFTKDTEFDIELKDNKRVHAATFYNSKNELKKIDINYADGHRKTKIYFKKSTPVLIIEDISLPTEYSFPFPVKGKKQAVVELNKSAKYKIYIRNWKKPIIKIVQISGYEYEFSKEYYQNLIEKVLAKN